MSDIKYTQRGGINLKFLGKGLAKGIQTSGKSVARSAKTSGKKAAVGFKKGAQAVAEEAAQIAADEARRIAIETTMAASQEAQRLANEGLRQASVKASKAIGVEPGLIGSQGVAPAPRLREEDILSLLTKTSNRGVPRREESQVRALPPLPEIPVAEVIRPVAQMASSERKTQILAQLNRCLPQIESMEEFGELLVQCLSQELGELYLPSRDLINELSNGLKTMKNSGVDFSDPEIVKVLLYGTRSTAIEKILDLVPGYDEVMSALDKISRGNKIPEAQLEELESATIQKMTELQQQSQEGGCGSFYFGKQPFHPVWGSQAPPFESGLAGQHGGGCGNFHFGKQPFHPVWGSQAPPFSTGLSGVQRGGSCGKIHKKNQRGGSRDQKGGADWMGRIRAVADRLGLRDEMEALQRILADGQISDEEFQELSARISDFTQKIPGSVKKTSPILSSPLTNPPANYERALPITYDEIGTNLAQEGGRRRRK